MSFIVAIDGPSGTGKGTITKLIANELGLLNIDTGAMYRCIALTCLRNNITTIEKKEEIIKIAKNIKIEMKDDKGTLQIVFSDVAGIKELQIRENLSKDTILNNYYLTE